MLSIDIPGFGSLELEHLVCDFTGTLSVDGSLLPGVGALLDELAASLKIHVVTADTFGRAHEELAGRPCTLTVLSGQNLDVQKERFVMALDKDRVVAVGNGANDRCMLRVSKLAIAVAEGEGCALDALLNADILVRSIHEGLSLLLNQKRIVATLKV
ncbi:MAG: ATPase P [Oryzomonas sp.]|uniref:HAD family hydrolase n=1 Tax=Oryzomonas sp. TaxID=2855186 RepID=UPI002849E8B2|nr:ATPase P [Oryzomonas sp.]MDR3581079.1 ATPase P [Oryzomonas sp.]